MSDQIYSSDNSGNLVPAVPTVADPVANSGIVTTLTTAGTGYSITVVGGVSYAVVCGKASASTSGDVISFSTTNGADTDANKEWNVGLGQTAIIHVPLGITTLYVVSTLSATKVYMSRLKMPG